MFLNELRQNYPLTVRFARAITWAIFPSPSRRFMNPYEPIGRHYWGK
jgi:hypothetical protein